MTVDETKGQSGQLTINGIFGNDPRPGGSDGSVEVGGAGAHINSWNAKEIVVDLALSGAGSAGNVVVTARGHKSNVARITEWRSNNFTYTYKENGSLQVQTIYTLHLRADLRKYRTAIHIPPQEPSGGIFSANDSTADFMGSGSGPGVDETFSLSGQGTLPNLFPTQQADHEFFLTGQFSQSSKLMTFGLAALSSNGCTCKVCDNIECFSNPFVVFGPSNTPLLSGGVTFYTFRLDDKANIVEGSPPDLHPPALCNVDNSTATGKFQWGSIAPTTDTAPDPRSAR
jgi:hypothetical protein